MEEGRDEQVGEGSEPPGAGISGKVCAQDLLKSLKIQQLRASLGGWGGHRARCIPTPLQKGVR